MPPMNSNNTGGSNSMALDAICLTEKQLEMHGSEFERYLQRYLFPCLIVFGIFGNALNLTVLLNRKMHSRANTFLAMLAFADIVFLSLLIPNILANYSLFSLNFHFRLFYLNAKVHLISIANWASAIAIWCVIAVCADRLIGIRNPLFARRRFPRYKMALVMAAILVVPALLTAHQHVSYACLIRSFCNGTQLYSRCLAVTQDRWFGPNQTNPYSHTFRQFISVNTLLNVVFSIIFPIILLTLLNTMLLCALRRRQYELANIAAKQIQPYKSNSYEGLSQQMVHSKTEQRVTWTVTLIVSMFTLTNGPSAAVHLLKEFWKGLPLSPAFWYNVTMACSTMVILGKVSNFILFCLSSKHFRRRLFALAQKQVHERLGSMNPERRRSSITGLMSSGAATRKGVSNKSSVTGENTRRTSQLLGLEGAETERRNGSGRAAEAADHRRMSNGALAVRATSNMI